MTFFDRAISLASLHQACLEEIRRDGPSGIDRQKPADFQRNLQKNLNLLHRELVDGSYRCQPVLQHSIPKKSGGLRTLGICTVRDRIVQRSLLLVLGPPLEKIFLDCSHGYRPRRSAKTAISQIQKLRGGVDILVATPGRLLDLYMQNAVKFSQVEILVLDEADRMLDMGFIRDIKKILALLPKNRQNLLFSATFSDDIRRLTDKLLNNPVQIEVSPRNAAAQSVKQSVYEVDKSQ